MNSRVAIAHDIVDLFLICDDKDGQYYQIWVNNKDSGFSLSALGRLPKGFQTVSFGDIGKLQVSVIRIRTN